jgi:phage gp36-like protein
MSRFIVATDYDMQIKQEIIKLLTATDFYNSVKLIRAESTAIAQIRNRIGKRYDCSLIFIEQGDPDMRDQWIVTITIDMALYHLYSQTGVKDIPEHRSTRYQDAIDWLKDVGNGSTPADLPMLTDEDGESISDVRIWGRDLNDHKY